MRFRLFSAAVLLTTIGISYAADPDSVGRGGMGKGLAQPELGEPSGPPGVRTKRDPVLPVHPHTGEPVHTGRILVKVRNDSRVRAAREFSNGLPAVADAESNDFGSVLALYSGRVRQLITSRSDAELAAITDRAEARSGRAQPDLTSFLVVETPGSLMMLAAQAINQLDSVEFVEIERQIVQAQNCTSVVDCGAGPPCNRPRSWGETNYIALSGANPASPTVGNSWRPTGPPDICPEACGQPGPPGNFGCNPFPGSTGADASYAGCRDPGCCELVSSIPDFEYCSDGDDPRGWDINCAALANFLCGDIDATPQSDNTTIYSATGYNPNLPYPGNVLTIGNAYDPCFSDFQIRGDFANVQPNPLFALVNAFQTLSGSCFVARDSRGCNKPACCFHVCNVEPLCCDLAWDTHCVDIAEQTAECVELPQSVATESLDLPAWNPATRTYTLTGFQPATTLTLTPQETYVDPSTGLNEPKVPLRNEGPWGSNPVNNCAAGTLQQTARRSVGIQAYMSYEAVIPGAGTPAGCQPGTPLAPGLSQTFEELSAGRGGGIDLYGLQRVMYEFAQYYQGGNGYHLPYVDGGNVRVGVIDLSANLFHEEFQFQAPWQTPATGATLTANPSVQAGVFRQPGNPNSNLVVEGWVPSPTNPGAGFGKVKLEPGVDQAFLAGDPTWAEHGTAVLSILLAEENQFGITGIANNSDGYFFPAILADTTNPTQITYRLADAITSAISLFDPGDVLCIPLSEADFQPLTTSAVTASLIRVASDSGIITVVSAGNGGLPVGESGIAEDTLALIVGAVGPGRPLTGSILPLSSAANCRVNSSNFTNLEEPPVGGRVQVAGWGGFVVAAGYGDLFRGENVQTPTSSGQSQPLLLNDGNNLRSYTAIFGGTSAAAAMVAGIAANIQGFTKQVYDQTPIGPEPMTELLTRLTSTSYLTCGNPQSGVGHFPNNLESIGYDVIQGNFFGTGQGAALDVAIINGVQVGPRPGVHQVRLADNVFLKVGTVSINTGQRARGLVYPITGATTDVLAILQSPVPPDEIDAVADRLQLELTGRTTSGFALVGVFLYNYESGRWDWQGIDFYDGGNAAYQIPLNTPYPPSYSASQYLDPSNGEMIVRVYTCSFGSSPSQVWHDLIQVSLGDPVKEP
jgi:hypothetical protein